MGGFLFIFLKRLFKSFLLIELLQGLKITWKHFLGKKITIMYPEEEIAKSDRFRGLHALMKYENGEERCIGCKLCEIICPAKAITIETSEREDGSRRTTRYEIDLFKCIFCGYCEEACPVDSIVQTEIYDYCFYDRNNCVITKDKLLAIGDQYHAEITSMKKNDSIYK